MASSWQRAFRFSALNSSNYNDIFRYGEGEPTDNSADFYSWVMDGMGTVADKGDQDDQMVDDKVCAKMPYFVFGLGNKTYEHYNAIARRLDARLTKLGALRVGVRGEGNDDER